MGLRRSYRIARARADILRRFRHRRDVWESAQHELPHDLFGAESRAALERYLAGDCAVRPASLDEICAWLRDCEYASDRDHFGVRDRWQHPDDFARLRRGDCEDHALWAWRALARLGVESRLVVGECIPPDIDRAGSHAWVIYADPDGREWLLETVAKRHDEIRRPLDEVRDRYHPHYAVDIRLVTHMYGGYASWTLMGSAAERARRRREFESRRDAPPLESIDFGAKRARWPMPRSARLRFTEDGLRIRALLGRGERLVPWSAVDRARLTANKGAVTLRLRARDHRGASIPLSHYRHARRLYDEIERRLPVGVEWGWLLAPRLGD